MLIANKYKTLHEGGRYKVLQPDGSFKIKSTGYGNGGGLKNILKNVKEFVDKNPGTLLLDYGCGSAEAWHKKILNDMSFTEHLGENLIGFYRYDPYHPKYNKRPDTKFDLTIVNDVIEHIPLEEIPGVLKDIASLTSGRIIISIPQRPSYAYFIDGENMHCTLMPKDEWEKLIRKYIPNHVITIIHTI